jgi:hypothetical protein
VKAGRRRALAAGCRGAVGAPGGGPHFSLLLQCDGKVRAESGSRPAQVSLALRDNNTTALIQQSNVLPVGERLKYVESPTTFSMTYKLPATRTPLFHDWWNGRLFVWMPALRKVSTIRLSIDRVRGTLGGEMLNGEGQKLATLAMDCQPVTEEMLEPRKF